MPTVTHGRRRVRTLSAYRDLLDDPSKVRWEQMSFGLLPEVAEHLGDWRPDIVFANNFETAIIGRMVADELGTPLVASYHEHAPESEPFGQGKMALAYRRLAPDVVLAGSLYYARRAGSFVPADRLRLVYHGIDTEVFRPGTDGAKARALYGVPDDAVLVVNVGRLKERKGQVELVQALAAIADPRVRLVIAGSVSSASTVYADRLAAEIRRCGLTGRVTVDQGVSHAEIPMLLAAADIVAQPSTSEGLGLSLLEAMSAGRPTVATRIEGFGEIFSAGSQPWDELAELADPGDVTSIRDAIRHLLDDPVRRGGLAVAGRQHVLTHFSRATMVESTEQVLRAACQSQVAAT
jgi:glycosyltransferase involved in cell wall biosynthesis